MRFPNSIGGGWLDEHGAARRGLIVHDPADRGASLASHGNHVAAVAHRHRHVGHALMRLELRHRALEQLHELALRAPQLAAQAPQRAGCLVAHRAVGIDRALDLILHALRDDERLHERMQHGAHDGARAGAAERLPGAARRAEQLRAAPELLARPRAADRAEPRERRRRDRESARDASRSSEVEHRAHRDHAPLLRLHPRNVAARLQRADARRAQRRRRAIRENVEHARILQNSERVFIHANAMYCGDELNGGCSTPLSRSG